MMTPQVWPVFICYRRVDGGLTGRRLHDILDKWQTADQAGQPVQLDVYLDETVPGVADWKAVHQPYLEKARALVVVCTPGTRINEGPDDWVHREIDWWLSHRTQAPILVDPLMEGLRYVPLQIARRWPDIQRLPLVEREWSLLSGSALEEKTAAIRRQIIGAILPSGAAIYAQEIAVERQRAERLKRALIAAVALLAAVVAAGGYAYDRQQAARRNQRIADASLLGTRAAGLFAESRLIAARRELEMDRSADILDAIGVAEPGVRERNLRHELRQVDADMRALAADSQQALERGQELLTQADAAWDALARDGAKGFERPPVEPPRILSVELINAGFGESILVHYGTPGSVRVVMINAGPQSAFENFIEPRLRRLSRLRFDGKPVSIELFVVGDRDADKTGGLERLLANIAATPRSEDRIAEIGGIWANIFRSDGFRAHLRELIDRCRIPLNQPFDRNIVRPERGRAVVTLPGGLDVVVLGPDQKRVESLHRWSAREAETRGRTIEPLLAETFGNVGIQTEPEPLTVAAATTALPGDCRPSENAQRLARGSYADSSVANLASTILLFRYQRRSFLFTGDARGDLILEGLANAGLLDARGQAHVDLMTVPHLGSDRNVTVSFFRQVRASGYLFSGDGRDGNPEITTVAALVAARGCDAYRMYFVNRGGAPASRPEDSAPRLADEAPERSREDEHGAKLDAFFQDEQQFNPNYRRIFRSSTGGSVIIDLLDPVRY